MNKTWQETQNSQSHVHNRDTPLAAPYVDRLAGLVADVLDVHGDVPAPDSHTHPNHPSRAEAAAGHPSCTICRSYLQPALCHTPLTQCGPHRPRRRRPAPNFTRSLCQKHAATPLLLANIYQTATRHIRHRFTYPEHCTGPWRQILPSNHIIIVNLHMNIRTKSRCHAFRGFIVTHH